MKYGDYVKITSWFYEWYYGHLVEQNELGYKVKIKYNPAVDFEEFTSWWIPCTSLELIK